MDTHPLRYSNPPGLLRPHIAQQQTEFYPAIEQQQTMRYPGISTVPTLAEQPTMVDLPRKKRRWSRLFAIAIIVALALMIYLIWRSAPPAPASPATVQQIQPGVASMTRGSATAATSLTSGASIKVYVTGAVKQPGVYTLDANARVYQLLQAAGGPLPNANLVALNLAAKLTDGQEVYVITVGETPPTYVGGVPGPDSSNSNSNSSSSNSGSATTATPSLPVNINTASVDQLKQGLHVSSATAQKIVDYRTQNGPYTSVDQLLQVVSRSIYDRIKSMVTVS
jgi:competence protein ComEA